MTQEGLNPFHIFPSMPLSKISQGIEGVIFGSFLKTSFVSIEDLQ